MTDKVIEEIYTIATHALQNGQPFFRVHIFPFHMTQERVEKEKASRWYSFWKNLKEGYAFFQTHHIPPNVTVKEKKYLFD